MNRSTIEESAKAFHAQLDALERYYQCGDHMIAVVTVVPVHDRACENRDEDRYGFNAVVYSYKKVEETVDGTTTFDYEHVDLGDLTSDELVLLSQVKRMCERWNANELATLNASDAINPQAISRRHRIRRRLVR